MSSLTQSPTWLALKAHQRAIAHQKIHDLFKQDPNRFDAFSIQFNDLLVDYSKQPINQETLNLLLALARQMNLDEWIKRMFQGDKINSTENRAALHCALRSKKTVMLDGEDITLKAKRVLKKMTLFSNAIRSGEYKGYTGEPITDIVNIGIGGSDLGPEMVAEALKPYKLPHLTPHFISNIDGAQLYETLQRLNVATTLFIVSSKTFTTQETLANANAARAWFLAQGGTEKDIARHFVAVTSNHAAVEKFGIRPDNIFEFWDWVGGRFSLWSAIGLPIALTIGMHHFQELLAGANVMDQHFAMTPLERNIPVILGLIAIWQINFCNVTSHAILPYAQNLHRLPAYLQQLEMESNGKSMTRDGEMVDYSTGVAIWGEPGVNGQHAFYQLLHQGTQSISADFLAPCQSQHPLNNHNLLLANFISQTEALMCGKSEDEVRSELKNQGMPTELLERLLPHKIHLGNHPTTSILFKKLDPKMLGMLIAMYEHKVFVQSVIWDINPFDQWGVELGKQLVDKILPELEQEGASSLHDTSTNGLINFFKKNQ